MNNKNRYVYVVNPGGFTGTPFFGVYEVENLVARPDALPEENTSENTLTSKGRAWLKSMVHLSKVSRRLVRDTVRNRVAKALGSTA